MRNSLQPVVNSALLSPRDVAYAFYKYPPLFRFLMKSAKAIEKSLELQGVVTGVTAISELESSARNKVVDTGMKFFSSAEKANQVRAALAAQYHAERMLPKLIEAHAKRKGITPAQTRIGRIFQWATEGGWMGMDTAGMERRLKKIGAGSGDMWKAIKTGEWTPEALEQIAYRFVSDTQFSLDSSTKRIWHHSGFARNVFKFKNFSFEQQRLINKHVLSEAAHGNIAPLVRFTIGAALVGEIYNMVRDELYGKDESFTGEALEGDLDLQRMANSIKDGGIGLIADVTYGGVFNWLKGPWGSTAGAVIEAGRGSDLQPDMTLTEIKNLVEREVPAIRQAKGLLRATGVLDDDAEFSADYTSLNGMSRRWAKDNDASAARSETWMDTLFPSTFGKKGPNTTAWRETRKAINRNDIEEAAEFLQIVIEGTPDEFKKDLSRSIRQAAERTSPLGPIKKRLRGQFMQSLDAEDRARAIDVQRQYLQRFGQAARLAVKNWREKTR
jgi:hypothetical protein